VSTDAITRETRIAASPRRVWDVVTRAEHIGCWFGDAGAELDLRPGGLLRLHYTEYGTYLGRVEEVVPMERFSFRWARPQDTEPAAGNSTLVEFRLYPDGDGTRLVVTESGFDQLDGSLDERARYRAGNVEGWEQVIGALVEYLRRSAAA
jgi:uncharacterized protein YndB with AHSA1/START domain